MSSLVGPTWKKKKNCKEQNGTDAMTWLHITCHFILCDDNMLRERARVLLEIGGGTFPNKIIDSTYLGELVVV